MTCIRRIRQIAKKSLSLTLTLSLGWFRPTHHRLFFLPFGITEAFLGGIDDSAAAMTHKHQYILAKTMHDGK